MTSIIKQFQDLLESALNGSMDRYETVIDAPSKYFAENAFHIWYTLYSQSTRGKVSQISDAPKGGIRFQFDEGKHQAVMRAADSYTENMSKATALEMQCVLDCFRQKLRNGYEDGGNMCAYTFDTPQEMTLFNVFLSCFRHAHGLSGGLPPACLHAGPPDNKPAIIMEKSYLDKILSAEKEAFPQIER